MIDVEVYFRTAPDKKARVKAKCHPDHSFASLIKNCCERLRTTVPGDYNPSDMCLVIGDLIVQGTSEATLKSKGLRQPADPSTSVQGAIEMQLMRMPSAPFSRPPVSESGSNTAPCVVTTAAEVQVAPVDLSGNDGPRSRLEARHREVSLDLVLKQQQVQEARRTQRSLVEQRAQLNDAAKELGDRNEILRSKVASVTTQRADMEKALKGMHHVEADFSQVSAELDAMSALLKQTNARVRELRAL